MGQRDDETFERACARWLARFVIERPSVRMDELRTAQNVLDAYPYNPIAARIALADFCGRYQLPEVANVAVNFRDPI
jgi:hypothetical protein